MNLEDRKHLLSMNAICGADKWFRNLSVEDQYYVMELASRVMNQACVMRMQGDRRRGLDIFPEAWAIVKNPEPKEPPEEGMQLPHIMNNNALTTPGKD